MKLSKNITDSKWFWITTAALAAGGTYFAVHGIKKGVKNAKSNQANRNIDKTGSKGNASILAQQAYAAFFPSGGPPDWTTLWVADGTDEDALYAIADKIKAKAVTWQDLSVAYKNLFDRNLTLDLNQELDTSELQIFWSRAGKTYAGLLGNVSALNLI